MPKCTIDGIEVEFEAGENLVDVAKSVGIEIPVFCYHPGLSVVAQCRMCAVDVEQMPNKLQTACSTEAREGMVVHTQSERALKNRESVMEFLLVNHPLDCPICDKAGECDLQDHSYNHGNAYMRSSKERRTYLDLDMGPVIEKNMNRCIHCTRCIRLGDEVLNLREMVALQRGNNTEISTLDGRPLETDYAGNYADVCPTGSLTLKDFRFNKRAWMLKKTRTICEGCSRGCNMEIHQDANVMHRCLPVENMEINKWWLCDEGRFHFRSLQSEKRVIDPRVGSESADWDDALKRAKTLSEGKSVAILLGSDMTQEEAVLVLDFAKKQLNGALVHHFGTPGVVNSSDDGDADRILKRMSKTSNLHGMEKLGIQGTELLPQADVYWVIRGGRATLPDLSDSTVIGVGVFMEDEVRDYSVVLPSLGFAEKDGTVVNYSGTEQKLKRAVTPPRTCKSFSEIAMVWTHSEHVSPETQGATL
ncbi:MAG: hypothetical protein CL678_09045 [Bdellovibrionaceae bacterium]|nr:hypothetical protein [Pseudobdellovibrionaceae bacterium]|tara:strand:- start:934 stop:2358 length:1425 start_codon:yes stop_codon:yes gene_type:complete